jgi:ssDNA-binding Zn-finger/Zn-ribbon topoisomerase 1
LNSKAKKGEIKEMDNKYQEALDIHKKRKGLIVVTVDEPSKLAYKKSFEILQELVDLEPEYHKLKAKDTAMKVTHEASIYECLTCPKCKNVVSRKENWHVFIGEIVIIPNYCPYCGQKLEMDK